MQHPGSFDQILVIAQALAPLVEVLAREGAHPAAFPSPATAGAIATDVEDFIQIKPAAVCTTATAAPSATALGGLASTLRKLTATPRAGFPAVGAFGVPGALTTPPLFASCLGRLFS